MRPATVESTSRHAAYSTAARCAIDVYFAPTPNNTAGTVRTTIFKSMPSDH